MDARLYFKMEVLDRCTAHAAAHVQLGEGPTCSAASHGVYFLTVAARGTYVSCCGWLGGHLPSRFEPSDRADLLTRQEVLGLQEIVAASAILVRPDVQLSRGDVLVTQQRGSEPQRRVVARGRGVIEHSTTDAAPDGVQAFLPRRFDVHGRQRPLDYCMWFPDPCPRVQLAEPPTLDGCVVLGDMTSRDQQHLRVKRANDFGIAG